MQDGQGRVAKVTAVEFIFGVFEAQFLAHEEARMFRIGLGFFKFTLRRSEHPG